MWHSNAIAFYEKNKENTTWSSFSP